ncbi:alpha-(1,4)-fucosyltransferase [Geobacter sp. OR-1]|uniref:glycosyltransferase family 10 domain-containing protein n=1 Tax=Geobacter sp. OR-1 TaxID=1266765 RepID=UPI000543753F|nr:glycosyltransferase family 10 [Geobacter sp. OR-1]GAM07924.1 alpha-(1,4)-fucosyltransferase [Geobacter sp. OR-1]
MKIAVCADIGQFHLDRLSDRNWSQQFLGSSWMTSLYERQTELGIEVASGDVALQRVQSGEWRAADVHVIQEMDARHGRELCRLGAVPSVLTMLESPLVAYRSVDRLIRSGVRFSHCIGPRGIFERAPALRDARHWRLWFPSYWRGQFPSPVPWQQRRHAVLVAANKYWCEQKWAQVESTKDVLRIVRHGIRKRLSPTYQSCKRLQLHDTRLELLNVLGRRGQVEVFGRGWDDTGNLPPHQAARLAAIHAVFKGPCGEKHELLSRYKFTIAFENTEYPGYVTEKPIDALVGASIPVYLGAPDIAEQLPGEAFIDARTFSSTEAIAAYLEQVTESEAGAMIASGQEFLRSPAGQRHTYEGFAEWVVALAAGKAPTE